ncbi:thiolase family protein [Rathayibacter soli]|uniref:thiolase family protein n=1 Tax=Rathayibacter soli TaxID=3144168 RepID=UPI0027E48898|nr:thiolase family protein [Glaciibacter superstes]
MQLNESVVIVDGARTAVGTYGGAFKSTPAFELGATAIREALKRSNVSSHDVDDVILGCVGQVGPDIFNARRASLAAGIPVGVNAYNVNRLCGSGLQAIWSGSMEILTGAADIVVAGGNENMTMQPFLDYQARSGYRLGHHELVDGTLSLVTDPWGNYAMGVTAENVATRFNVSRNDQDEFALVSQQRAAAAQSAGVFAKEIVEVVVKDRKQERVIDTDEHPRPDTTLEGLARLRPAFTPEGMVTAGNSSGINDAGSAVVLMAESAAKERGLVPKARLVAFAMNAIEPEIMGYAPVGAIERVLDSAKMTLADIDTIELNEAFAAQSVAVIRGAGLDPAKVNPYGGAIALGHPVGATGAILALRAAYDLHRRDLEFALVTMCIGGGQAIATILQRC